MNGRTVVPMAAFILEPAYRVDVSDTMSVGLEVNLTVLQGKRVVDGDGGYGGGDPQVAGTNAGLYHTLDSGIGAKLVIGTKF